MSSTAPIIREILPKSSGDDKRWEYARVEELKRIFQKGMTAAADGDLSLTLIHLPAPHPPSVYDRRKKDFTFEAFESGCNYFGNLELVDRVFGEMRRAMEGEGVWDQSVVLVSSDHWWRIKLWRNQQSWTEEEEKYAAKSEEQDYRVPFILKILLAKCAGNAQDDKKSSAMLF